MLTTRAHNRVAALTAVGVAVGLTLSACTFFTRTSPVEQDPDVSQPTGEQVAPELEHFYSQLLRWEDCGLDAQCTTATAPMNWAEPASGETVSLALVRHRANDGAIGSLFVNPGGPGASGYDFVHDPSDIDFAVSETLQDNFDVIGWDPRGVGRSTPIDCYADSDLDDYIYGVPDAEFNSPEWSEELDEQGEEFAAACGATTGPVLQFVDTASTVHDLDLLRALVGDEKLNYLGYSYGTEIGSQYIGAFPTKVGRLVLDGAVDPTLDQFHVVLAQNAAFEDALESYLTACPDTKDCPFSGHLDRDLTTVALLYDELNDEPIVAEDGRLMTGSVLQTAVFAALYSEDLWPYLNDMFHEVVVDDASTGFLLADYYNGRTETGHYQDNSYEAFVGIRCLDSPTVTDPAVIAAQVDQLIAVAPTFNRPTTVWDPVCANWPFAPTGAPPAPASNVATDPVLVIATTGDPATPYEWGVALADQLGSATLISFTGEGHTAYNKGSTCVDTAVDDYFVSGTVPATDPNC